MNVGKKKCVHDFNISLIEDCMVLPNSNNEREMKTQLQIMIDAE